MSEIKSRSLKATWGQALVAFLTPIAFILVARWLLIEPYVIPSGSMIPTLLVHDHVFVNKLAYGVRVPFSREWLVRWASPQHGDVIVFYYPENTELFYVKRVIGVGGDRIHIEGRRIWLNDQEIKQSELTAKIRPLRQGEGDEEGYQIRVENGHYVRFQKFSELEERPPEDVTVPEDSLFVMGDNRDESSDSRVWGFVPRTHVLGKASMIWLACEDTMASAPMICDVPTIRWKRLLTFIHERVDLK